MRAGTRKYSKNVISNEYDLCWETAPRLPASGPDVGDLGICTAMPWFEMTVMGALLILYPYYSGSFRGFS